MKRARLAHSYEPAAEAPVSDPFRLPSAPLGVVQGGDAMDDAVLTTAIAQQHLESLRVAVGLAEMLAKRVASGSHVGG